MTHPIITLERFCYGPMGTFGRLKLKISDPPGSSYLVQFKCFTVERPWLDNKPSISCIPEGRYTLRLGMYNRGGYPAYEVVNDPPGRDLIKIHIANQPDQVQGCIGLGNFYAESFHGVVDSGPAFAEFMTAMDDVPTAELRISQIKGAV